MPWSGDGNEGFALSNIPKGWIVCDGLLKNAVDYPLLAAQLGDSYGASDDFSGNFPEYIGQFRVPNMTLKLPMDLEPEYLLQPKYQYGQNDVYQKLVSAPFDGDALVGGFGSISLQAPIITSISANCDIDFTVDASIVMSGKMTNITVAPPDFAATVYTINRKLGINHTPSHGHSGQYSRANPQFTGPMPFEPGRVDAIGGPVQGSCTTFGYSECQFSDPTVPPSWQQGINQITYYGDETHEYTLPITDKFYDFSDGGQYWDQVPAQSWPPPGPHPSGLQAASDLSYTFFGSTYTEQFTVQTPVKNHAQPAWTGVFPRPMEAGNRRNHFGDANNYNPDTVSPFQVSNVTLQANTTSITLPAGTDLGTNLTAIVPLMWIYSAGSADSTALPGQIKYSGGFQLYDDLSESTAGYYDKELNEWAYVSLGINEGIWTSMTQSIEQNVSMSGGSGSGLVVRARFEPYGDINGGNTSTGGINLSGMKLYEDPSSPQGNNLNPDVTSSGYYTRNLGDWAYIDDGSGGQYWFNGDDAFEGDVNVTGGSGTGAVLNVRVEAWPQPFEAGGRFDQNAWSGYNEQSGGYNWTGSDGFYARSKDGIGNDSNDWNYVDDGGNPEFWETSSDEYTATYEMQGGSGTGMRLQIRMQAREGSGGNPNNTRWRIESVVDQGSGYEAGDILHWDFQTPWMATNNVAATSLSPDPLRLDAVEGEEYPGNTRYRINSIKTNGYDYQNGDRISFEFNTARRAQLGLGPVEIYSGASGVIEVQQADAPGSGGTVPINTRYKVISIVNPGQGYGNGETLNFDNTIFNPDTNQFNTFFRIRSNGVYAGGEVLSSSTDIRPGTQVTSIARNNSNQYVIGLSQATLNTSITTGNTISFQHGTYPTTLNNITSQLDPNSTTFLGHNHGSFELNQTQGSLAAPAVHPVNNISLGDVAPENINDALNIVAEVAMPALVTTFIIKAY